MDKIELKEKIEQAILRQGDGRKGDEVETVFLDNCYLDTTTSDFMVRVSEELSDNGYTHFWLELDDEQDMYAVVEIRTDKKSYFVGYRYDIEYYQIETLEDFIKFIIELEEEAIEALKDIKNNIAK